MSIFFSLSTLASMVRLTAPLAFATMGACFGHKAKIFNIGMESYVLISAFFSTLGSYLFKNPWMGLLFGIISGILTSAVFGTFVLHFKGDPFVVGIAMNLGASSLTSLLLLMIFKTRGSFSSPDIVGFSRVNIPFLENIPVLNQIFNNHYSIVYLAFIVVIFSQILMYKTPFGLRLRGVGINEKASESVGVSVIKYKWYSLILTGIFTGMAGACLPLCGLSMFTENMSAGKGFLAVSAARIGVGDPLKSLIACIIFSYVDALSVSLNSINIPSQIVLMAPYVVTVIVMCFTSSEHPKKLHLKREKKERVSA